MQQERASLGDGIEGKVKEVNFKESRIGYLQLTIWTYRKTDTNSYRVAWVAIKKNLHNSMFSGSINL